MCVCPSSSLPGNLSDQAGAATNIIPCTHKYNYGVGTNTNSKDSAEKSTRTPWTQNKVWKEGGLGYRLWLMGSTVSRSTYIHHRQCKTLGSHQSGMNYCSRPRMKRSKEQMIKCTQSDNPELNCEGGGEGGIENSKTDQGKGQKFLHQWPNQFRKKWTTINHSQSICQSQFCIGLLAGSQPHSHCWRELVKHLNIAHPQVSIAHPQLCKCKSFGRSSAS